MKLKDNIRHIRIQSRISLFSGIALILISLRAMFYLARTYHQYTLGGFVFVIGTAIGLILLLRWTNLKSIAENKEFILFRRRVKKTIKDAKTKTSR